MSALERSTKAANALGGKTARACECCLVRRARWFCSADDAFLCQACDVSVHSANLLASKHERLRLETSSYKVDHDVVESSSSPSWHQGFTKKARTPRQPKLSRSSRSQLQPSSNPIDPLVPEYNSDDYPFHQYNESEEQSVCRVPVFDPANFEDQYFRVKLGEEGIGGGGGDRHDDLDMEGLFTACDVDSLFGVSKDLGLGRSVFESEEDAGHGCNEHLVLQNKWDDEECDGKVQRAPACHFESSTLDMELMNWDFDYTTDSMTDGEIKTDQTTVLDEATKNSCHDNKKNVTDDSDHQSQKYRTNMLPRLDYEAIIAAWTSQDSPWIDGVRPHLFNIDEFMVACIGKFRSGPASDAEREARVSRYREKRRTRLFSKKIRYQVRKLNAENRPRIKGRFVKRTTTNFSGNSYPYYSLVNNS